MYLDGKIEHLHQMSKFFSDWTAVSLSRPPISGTQHRIELVAADLTLWNVCALWLEQMVHDQVKKDNVQCDAVKELPGSVLGTHRR